VNNRHKKSLPLLEEGCIFDLVVHSYLSSILVANNDNDDHNERDSPIELSYDVINLVIVFIYPHGRNALLFNCTKVLVIEIKNNTIKKFSDFANKSSLFENIEI
jgi:hypothetical protein